MTWKEIIASYGTQQQFADHYGIPKRTVENWYEGNRQPPEYVKRLICKDLNLPIDKEPET